MRINHFLISSYIIYLARIMHILVIKWLYSPIRSHIVTKYSNNLILYRFYYHKLYISTYCIEYVLLPAY
jgi:hypothetical protein